MKALRCLLGTQLGRPMQRIQSDESAVDHFKALHAAQAADGVG